MLPTGIVNVTDLFVNNADTITVTGFGSEATAVTAGNETVGADTSALSWTYANETAALGF